MHLDSESKKQVIRNLFEHGWNQQQFDSFATYIGDEILFNFRGQRQITNIEELKGLVALWRNAFHGLQFQVLEIIVENNLAAANLLFTGTHSGLWQGLKPAGQEISVEEMMFFRFDQGKVVELWEVYDEATMMKQITAESTDQ